MNDESNCRDTDGALTDIFGVTKRLQFVVAPLGAILL